MEIVVVLEQQFAAAFLMRDRKAPEVAELLMALQCLGLELIPMHAGSRDPTLSSYFVVSGSEDSLAAPAVIERLLRCEAVDGAYAKPAGEPPD